ncbi:MAG: hypothetical protein M1820_000899 [Bogoriella megaspora]|nr:MAG: hypothetical protein M1820_000899 [Bogoriella megaspora]
MIPTFDDFATPLSEVAALSELSGSVVAIEAGHYLTQLLTNPTSREPLLAALGGLPFTMRATVTEDIRLFREYDITPIFVFDGLDVRRVNGFFQQADEAIRANASAWDLYNRHQAGEAVSAFGESPAITAESFYRFFQEILSELGVFFLVAPYSAIAQLAYMQQNSSELVDAICGSSELLLFDVDKIITKIQLPKGDHEDRTRLLPAEFTWLKRRTCLESLGNIPSDVFIDACMLSGSAFLPTLPQLENSSRKPTRIKAALDLMNNFGRSGIAVCLHYQDEPALQQIGYLDRYRKSRVAIKHHVVLTKEGRIELLDQRSAPGDVWEFMGQRLPDEVYAYLSRGLISPRVLGWRTMGEIEQGPPLDNGESEHYQRFVREQIVPLRVAALSLLSHHLHRFYLYTDVNLRVWFDRSKTTSLSMREMEDPRPILSTWHVKSDNLKNRSLAGILGTAVASLEDSTFAKQTVSPKDQSKLLQTQDEILYNTMWRFLHLRGYINNDHQLTPWGKVLQTGLAQVGLDVEHQEAILVAVELLRLEMLPGDYMFKGYSHAPIRGTDSDRKFNTLVSRIACLGRLRHKPIGFTGPLSRHLLGYHSMTTTMRQALRDLEEMCLLTLFLNGDAERDREDFPQLAFGLPFLTDNDCGLGIAVKSYLDELVSKDDPTNPATKEEVREKGPKEWFPYGEDFDGDLARAFKLWDAVYAAVMSSGDLVKDKSHWQKTDEWLAQRR